MHTLLLIFIAVVVLALIRWAFEPYLSWKRECSKRSLQPVAVTDQLGKIMNLAEFKERQKTQPKLLFSLVIPSYNEEKRIGFMLQETIDFFKKTDYSYEIIIVNDGSKDKTDVVAFQIANKSKIDNFYVVNYPRNRGKGGAIRVGMQLAIGQYHLMVDADGATQFSQLKKVFNRMELQQKNAGNPLVMVAGSRHHLTEEESVDLKRKWYRKVFALVFHLILRYFCGIKINDTQCGFKLFTQESSRILFQTLHVEKWAFDVELFVMSNHFGIKCFQVPVNWEDKQGSKLNLLSASVTMFRDILLIRVFYLLGLWSYSDKSRIT